MGNPSPRIASDGASSDQPGSLVVGAWPGLFVLRSRSDNGHLAGARRAIVVLLIDERDRTIRLFAIARVLKHGLVFMGVDVDVEVHVAVRTVSPIDPERLAENEESVEEKVDDHWYSTISTDNA